jgi:GNAT superfamily N-acetyltransferase
LDIDIKRVGSEHDIRIVSALAELIWTQHFTPIIGRAQVSYMLQKFQRYESIYTQIHDGYEYYLVNEKDNPSGYFAIIPDYNSKKVMLSKIYLKLDVRGKGYGKKILQFIEEKTQSMHIDVLWLTVNRFNYDSINWYVRRGFKITKEVKTDIGGGFFMDDFIMEKTSSRFPGP